MEVPSYLKEELKEEIAKFEEEHKEKIEKMNTYNLSVTLRGEVKKLETKTYHSMGQLK